jgi:hypothetical protein
MKEITIILLVITLMNEDLMSQGKSKFGEQQSKLLYQSQAIVCCNGAMEFPKGKESDAKLLQDLRLQLIKDKAYDKLSDADTLWMIERNSVEYPPNIWGAVWNSNRDSVLLYEHVFREITKDHKDLFITTVLYISYLDCKDSLKLITENFDTTTINKNKTVILDGSGVFISQIVNGNQVKTYSFADIFFNWEYPALLELFKKKK